MAEWEWEAFVKITSLKGGVYLSERLKKGAFILSNRVHLIKLEKIENSLKFTRINSQVQFYNDFLE